jgi:hypothetical protein
MDMFLDIYGYMDMGYSRLQLDCSNLHISMFLDIYGYVSGYIWRCVVGV